MNLPSPISKSSSSSSVFPVSSPSRLRFMFQTRPKVNEKKTKFIFLGAICTSAPCRLSLQKQTILRADRLWYFLYDWPTLQLRRQKEVVLHREQFRRKKVTGKFRRLCSLADQQSLSRRPWRMKCGRSGK